MVDTECVVLLEKNHAVRRVRHVGRRPAVQIRGCIGSRRIVVNGYEGAGSSVKAGKV